MMCPLLGRNCLTDECVLAMFNDDGEFNACVFKSIADSLIKQEGF